MHGLNWRAKGHCAPNKWGQTGIEGAPAKMFGHFTGNFSPSQFFIACTTRGTSISSGKSHYFQLCSDFSAKFEEIEQ